GHGCVVDRGKVSRAVRDHRDLGVRKRQERFAALMRLPPGFQASVKQGTPRHRLGLDSRPVAANVLEIMEALTLTVDGQPRLGDHLDFAHDGLLSLRPSAAYPRAVRIASLMSPASTATGS